MTCKHQKSQPREARLPDARNSPDHLVGAVCRAPAPLGRSDADQLRRRRVAGGPGSRCRGSSAHILPDLRLMRPARRQARSATQSSGGCRYTKHEQRTSCSRKLAASVAGFKEQVRDAAEPQGARPRGRPPEAQTEERHRSAISASTSGMRRSPTRGSLSSRGR